MPARLKEIFDTGITPIEERQKKIAECNYIPPNLRIAEDYKIFQTSTPINNTEELARILEFPNGIEDLENGVYSAQAFMEATRRGISTQRLSMTTPLTIHAQGKLKSAEFNKLNPHRPREYVGYTLGLVDLFRTALAPDGRRIFGVFSTPEPELAHADIFVILKPDKALKLAIQRVFHDVFRVDKIYPPT
ncbi:hypothetical protein N7650_14715 [Pseudomonas sp. GD04058]|uniref:hypothetical protein n=1 Tax=Pseudomonas sp. GD04058 TaxID=2975429 RepID=UPI0024491DFE|nr:hypothetical protein [Pseudomonas sp. GD04058]MDG9884089.1 hypothetical protein [Pseudomonas sp. GD04058]